MKEKFIIWKSLLVILIVILITSCEWENDYIPVEPIDTIVKTHTIISSVSKGGTVNPLGVTVVNDGDSVNYNIFSDENYTLYNIQINGVDQPVSNVFSVKDIKSDKNINFNFLPTYALLLNKTPWYLKSVDSYEDDVYVYSLSLNREQLTSKYYYHLTGTFLGTNCDYVSSGIGLYEVFTSKGDLISNGTWSISPDGKIFNEMGGDQEIVELSEKTFSRIHNYSTLPNGKTSYTKDTYWRR